MILGQPGCIPVILEITVMISNDSDLGAMINPIAGAPNPEVPECVVFSLVGGLS